MKEKSLSILLLIIAFTFGCNNPEKKISSKNSLTDDLYKEFNLDKIPERVITLAPNLTEFIYKLGIGYKIVGNTTYCNYPDSATKTKKVGDLLTIDLEKISTLQPDIIFITVEGNSKTNYNKLVELGYNVFASNPKHFNGIKKCMLDLGKIFGVRSIADSIVSDWNFRIKNVTNKHDSLFSNSALFLVSIKPILAVGSNTFVHGILTLAGLKNIANDPKVSYPIFSSEEILKRFPDYLIFYETNNNNITDLLKVYPEWNTLPAVINNNVFFINADVFSRPGPRFVEAVEELNKAINN